MRFVVVSLVVHAVALLVLVRAPRHVRELPSSASAGVPPVPVEMEMVFDVVAVAPTASEGGGSPRGVARQATPGRTRAASSKTVWDGLEITQERSGVGGGNGVTGGRHGASDDGHGEGDGDGAGGGHGWGIGFGTGGGIQTAERVPAPPRVIDPPPSRARPAKLVYPVRDREVEDEGNLFIARITVDADGDVVGAHMVKTRPGVTGDQAASAIWAFRYLPALDERGTPIRSTFEQPFQIR